MAKGKLFFCTICNKSYTKRHRVVTHMHKCHNGEQLFSCDVCERDFEIESALQNHTKKCHGNFLSCDQCSQKFGSKKKLLMHQKLFHSAKHDGKGTMQFKEEANTCPEKTRTAPGAKPMVTRNSISDKRKHRLDCRECDKSFANKTTLDNHENKYHSKSLKSFNNEDRASAPVSEYPANVDQRGSTEDSTEDRFNCRLCGSAFSTQDNLSSHLILCHSYLRCSVCGEIFPHINAETKHKEQCHPELSLICSFCPNTFQTRETTLSHMTQFHAGIRCRICKQWFSGRANIIIHMNICGRAVVRIYKCHLCDIQCTDFTNLSTHIKACHLTETFQCRICSKVLESLADRSAHEHSCSALTKCTICSKTFYTNADLSRHVAKCHLKCNICGESFENENALSTHVSTFHRGKKSFICTQCNKMFKQAHVLKAHMIVMHGKSKDSMKKATYKCQICSKDFAHEHSLQLHIKTHGFGKQLKCGVCSEMFAKITEHIELFHREENVKQYIVESIFGASSGQSASSSLREEQRMSVRSEGSAPDTNSGDVAKTREDCSPQIASEDCSPQIASEGSGVHVPRESFSRTVAGVDGHDEGYIATEVLQRAYQKEAVSLHIGDIQSEDSKDPSETYDMLVSFLTDETMKTDASKSLQTGEEPSHAAVTTDAHSDLAAGVVDNDLQHSVHHEDSDHDGHLQHAAPLFLDSDQKRQQDDLQVMQPQKKLDSMEECHSRDLSQIVGEGLATLNNVDPVVRLSPLKCTAKSIDESDIYLTLRNSDPNGDVDMRLLQPARQCDPSRRQSQPYASAENTNSQLGDDMQTNTDQAQRRSSSMQDQCRKTEAYAVDKKCILEEKKVDSRVVMIEVDGADMNSNYLVMDTVDVSPGLYTGEAAAKGNNYHLDVKNGDSRSDVQNGDKNGDVNMTNIDTGELCAIPDAVDRLVPLLGDAGAGNSTLQAYTSTHCVTSYCASDEIQTSEEPINIELMVVEPDAVVSPREPAGSTVQGKDCEFSITVMEQLAERDHPVVDALKISGATDKQAAQTRDFQSSENDETKRVHFDYQSNFQRFCENTARRLISVSEDDTNSQTERSPLDSYGIAEGCISSPEYQTNIGIPSGERSTNRRKSRRGASSYAVGDRTYSRVKVSTDTSRSMPSIEHSPSMNDCDKFGEDMKSSNDGSGQSERRLTSNRNKDRCSSQFLANVHARSPRDERQTTNAHVGEGEMNENTFLISPKSLQAVSLITNVEEVFCLTQTASCLQENRSKQTTVTRTKIVGHSSPSYDSPQMANGTNVSQMCDLGQFLSPLQQVPPSKTQVERDSSTIEPSSMSVSQVGQALAPSRHVPMTEHVPPETSRNTSDCTSEGHQTLGIDPGTSLGPLQTTESGPLQTTESGPLQTTESGPLQTRERSSTPPVSVAPSFISARCNPQQVLSENVTSSNIPDNRRQPSSQDSSLNCVQSVSRLQHFNTTDVLAPMNLRKVWPSNHKSSKYRNSGPLQDSHRKHVQFTCGLCQEVLPTVEALNKHKQMQHSLRCTQCGKTYTRMMDLIDHYDSCP